MPALGYALGMGDLSESSLYPKGEVQLWHPPSLDT